MTTLNLKLKELGENELNDLLCIAILSSRYQNNDGANLKNKTKKIRIFNINFTTRQHLFMN